MDSINTKHQCQLHFLNETAQSLFAAALAGSSIAFFKQLGYIFYFSNSRHECLTKNIHRSRKNKKNFINCLKSYDKDKDKRYVCDVPFHTFTLFFFRDASMREQNSAKQYYNYFSLYPVSNGSSSKKSVLSAILTAIVLPKTHELKIRVNSDTDLFKTKSCMDIRHTKMRQQSRNNNTTVLSRIREQKDPPSARSWILLGGCERTNFDIGLQHKRQRLYKLLRVPERRYRYCTTVNKVYKIHPSFLYKPTRTTDRFPNYLLGRTHELYIDKIITISRFTATSSIFFRLEVR